VHLHPLDPSVKCHHCGKGDLVFVRTWKSRDLYRCVAGIPCKSYTVHSRPGGRMCGIGAEVGTGLVTNWVECARRELAKGT
jgi:hypothetical protein